MCHLQLRTSPLKSLTMTTLSLQDVDNKVQGRLALVTGST